MSLFKEKYGAISDQDVQGIRYYLAQDFLKQSKRKTKQQKFSDAFHYLEKIGWSKEMLRAMFMDNPIWFVDTLIKFNEQLRKVKPYIHEGVIDINAFAQSHPPLYIRTYEVASINAINGLMRTTGLLPENIHPVYDVKEFPNAPQLIANKLPGVVAEPMNLMVRNEREDVMKFVDDPMKARWDRGLSYVPFKYAISYKPNARFKSKMRSILNIEEGRKVVVVLSPSEEEAEAVLQSTRNIPPEERPMVIMAMREKNEQVESKARELYPTVTVRDPDANGQGDMRKIPAADVFIINTQGEMLSKNKDFPGFLYAADLAISGSNRNLFEPASIGVPILCFNGYWYENLLALNLMRKHNAVQMIGDHLESQILGTLENTDPMKKGLRAALRDFESNIIPRTGKMADLGWMLLILDRTARKSKSSSSDAAMAVQVASIQGRRLTPNGLLSNKDFKRRVLLSLVRGLTYEEAKRWYRLKLRSDVRIPNEIWSNPESVKQFIYVVLDSNISGFKELRESKKKTRIKEMADLYREKVIHYKAIDRKRYQDGQTGFFLEKGKLKGLMSRSRLFLEEQGSPSALLKFVLPELVDQKNRDALKLLEIEDDYWDDEDNAREAIYKALDTRRGFKKARLEGNIAEMARIYRNRVLKYKAKDPKNHNGQQAFFYEVGGLKSLMNRRRTFLEKTNSAGALLEFALAELVNQDNSLALRSWEIGYKTKVRPRVEKAMTVGQVKQIMDILFTGKDFLDLWTSAQMGNERYDERIDKDLVASIWQPYFQQIIDESGLSVNGFIVKLKKGELSFKLINQLKGPMSRMNKASQGIMSKDAFDSATVKDQLKRRIRSLVGKNNKAGKIEIVLGGTAYSEVMTVVKMVDDVLRETAHDLHIQDEDVEGWIQRWKIRIRALSIQTAYLVEVDKKFNEQKFFHKNWLN